jgi:hypothetical protein
MEKDTAKLVGALLVVLALALVAMRLFPGTPAPGPAQNLTLIIYYEGPWHGAISDPIGVSSIAGENQTWITIGNLPEYVDVRVVKGDGSSRELRVVLVADETRVVQDRTTDAPYGVIMFRATP